MAAVHHPVLQFHQFALQAEQFLKVAFARSFLFFSLWGSGGRKFFDVAVFEFHFQLFVVAVHQVLAKAADQVFLLGCIKGHGVACKRGVNQTP